jgi:pyridoxal 5-phosphate dependent beta-lyase
MDLGGLPARWRVWASQRPAPQVLHLDSAAAGRASFGTLRAVGDHARREAEIGAYVAEAEAAPALAAAREAAAGLAGVSAEGVAFVESASAALHRLMNVWPLGEGATVGVVASEWGPNVEAFAGRGLGIVDLPADSGGRLDLDAFSRVLRDTPPTIVHLTQVASHRGLVQPVAEAAALCRAASVPLWVDAAQAIGHVDIACGADVVYATSRKWLAGPRGVGVLAVADRCWPALRVRRAAMLPDDLPTVHRLESHDAHVAGRLGLGAAIREYVEAGPAEVWRRLGEVGKMTREALADTPGWQLVGATAACAITALRPTGGQDVAKTQSRLLDDHGILVTSEQPARAPRDMREPLLRISPHVDCTIDGLLRVRSALAEHRP